MSRPGSLGIDIEDSGRRRALSHADDGIWSLRALLAPGSIEFQRDVANEDREIGCRQVRRHWRSCLLRTVKAVLASVAFRQADLWAYELSTIGTLTVSSFDV
jgi:hypothetical protein